jgi:hypothetical protein
MILKLTIDKKEQIFSIPFVNGMVYRKFIEYRTRMDLNNLTPEELDELVGLVVEAFDNIFTIEQFYVGIPHDEVMLTLDRLFLPTNKNEKVIEGNEKK